MTTLSDLVDAALRLKTEGATSVTVTSSSVEATFPGRASSTKVAARRVSRRKSLEAERADREAAEQARQERELGRI